MKMAHDQCKDTGLAILLVLLLFVQFGGKHFLLIPAIVVVLIVMTVPRVFAPVVRLWFGCSHLLGCIVTNVLLCLIYYLVVAPVGLARRAKGADSMQRNRWKKDNFSVFKVRESEFSKDDMEKPF